MIIRNEIELSKCRSLRVEVASNPELCRLLAQSVGLPTFEQLLHSAEFKQGAVLTIMGEAMHKVTHQYLLVVMSIIDGEPHYQALTCKKITTDGLAGYCYIQSKKERLQEEVEQLNGEQKAFNKAELLKAFLGEHTEN